MLDIPVSDHYNVRLFFRASKAAYRQSITRLLAKAALSSLGRIYRRLLLCPSAYQ